jgi:integrase/recombinase XerC
MIGSETLVRAALPAAALPTILDPVALLLADKRSPATKRAYRGDLVDFFGGEPAPGQVEAFLALPAPAVALRLATYKAGLVERGAAEATVNRRLAAIRSLLKFCHRLGLATTDGRGLVDGEKVRAYRDTRGVKLNVLTELVKAPGTATPRGLRDTAILRLLAENALRCAELVNLDVADFDREGRRLLILGKGRGTQKEPITLSQGTADAIAAYLGAAGHVEGAMFRNVDRRPGCQGDRITTNGVRFIVGDYGRQVGVKGLTPHKLRHSAITAALDATNGNVRAVQRLSRHAKLETLQRYDDNRADLQGGVTELLAELIDGSG